MKATKSTQSLHCSPPVLRQHPSNSTLSLWKAHKPTRRDVPSVYNARGRLNCLGEAVGVLAEVSRDAEVMNKELKLEIDFLREEYLQRRLQQLEMQLNGKVKQLRKKVLIAKRSDLLKYESIQNIFDSLAKSHKELTAKVQQIEERVEQLENVMGGGEALRSRLGR